MPHGTPRPDGTPFEDGVFKLTLQFTEEYPNRAPKVKFVTRVFHPNGVVVEILGEQWDGFG